MTTREESIIYEFDSFRIDVGKRLLFRSEGETIPLTPKAFETLVFLVRNAGRVIEKDELMSAVWADTIVEENNLNKNISVLRRVLGEDPGQHRFIVTIPGKGYKFVAAVQAAETGISQILRSLPPAKNRPGFRFGLATAGGFLLIAASVAGLWYWLRSSSSVSGKRPRTIAILPFRPLLEDDRDEALELGMTDILISRIGSSREIIVRPLTSVRSFGGLEQDAVAAGRALDVEAVLEGSIHRNVDRMRVNVRLVRVADGSMLWTETFDNTFTDIFVVQDAISSRVANALSLQLSRVGQNRLTKRYTDNIEAYQAFARGRFHLEKYNPQDARRSLAFFQQAITLDSNFAAAYAYLAAVYAGVAGTKDFPRRETVLLARENALKAISLDDQLSSGHEVYGVILSRYDYEFVAGERELVRAIDLDPNDASAHETYGGLLVALGRFDEGMAEMRRAAEIDPLSASISASVGNSLLHARRYDEAIAQFKQALELDDRFANTHYGLAIAYQMKGQYPESAEERAKLTEIAQDHAGATFIRQSFARHGWHGLLREMIENPAAPPVPAFARAALLAELGENDKAFEILNGLYDEHSSSLVLLGVDPRFDKLKSDARLEVILRKMNLPRSATQ